MPVPRQPLPHWARKFRPPVAHYGMGNDPGQHNRQSIAIGVLATVLVHLSFFFVPRSTFEVETTVPPPVSEEIELELPAFAEEEAPPPDEAPRYVETNPDAPENVPDETANESDRNQQAANEITPEGLSPDRTPARDGEEDVESNKIVPGSLEPVVPVVPVAPEGEPAPAVEPSLPTAQDPLPGNEEDRGDDPDGVGTSVAPPSTDPKPIDEHVEGEETESTDTRPLVRASSGGVQRPQPAPRPRVVRTPPGPVRRESLGLSQTGYVGVDARFSQFGEYMARMVEAVSQRWNALCSSRAYGETSTMVRIRFTLTRDGNIRAMETLETTAQSVGVLLCRTAIEQGQSYGLWTEDMVATLGEEDEVTFTFFYR